MASLTIETSQKIIATFTNLLFLLGLMPYSLQSAEAQTTLACEDVTVDLLTLSNNAFIRYKTRQHSPTALGTTSNVAEATPEGFGIVTNSANTEANPNSEKNLPLRLVSLGIEDLEGNTITGLGAIAIDLTDLYEQAGLDEATARAASFTTIDRWSKLLPETASAQIVEAVRRSRSVS